MRGGVRKRVRPKTRWSSSDLSGDCMDEQDLLDDDYDDTD
jgi:hypothetical protein